jgi:hypothetical protein
MLTQKRPHARRPSAQGYDENLGNSSSKLTVRYDLVFVKGLSALDVKVVGDKTTDKTPSGLWPSDHAGVIATLR